jgi:hypothetical protein
VLEQAIDNIVTELGDKKYAHYLLSIEDAKSYSRKSPAFLEFSGDTLWDKYHTPIGPRCDTILGERYVISEYMIGTLSRLSLDYVFKNIKAALGEAMERLEDNELSCFSINFSETDLTFDDFLNEFDFILDPEHDQWGSSLDVKTKTLSIFIR